MKRSISILLSIILILLLLPTSAMAEAEISTTEFKAELVQAGSNNPPQTVPSSGMQLPSAMDYDNRLNIFNIDSMRLLSPSAMDSVGAYLAIYNGLKNRQTVINVEQYNIPLLYNTIDGIDATIAINLYSKVINDNGELFYVDSWVGIASYTSPTVVVAFYPRYLSEITQTEMDLFNKKVEYILSKATGKYMNDEDKVLAIHDYLVNNCEYDIDNYNAGTLPPLSFTAYGAIVSKVAVCQGYSLAMNLLLKKLGVPSLYVTSDPMDHGWSMVSLDELWYHVDSTWDDYPNVPNLARHYYFLLSDATMRARGHHDWNTALPVCANTKYEADYPFNGNQSVFSYKDGQFWYKVGTSYYRTYFSGNTIPVSAQEYIINPDTPYTLNYPIVYDLEGNVETTTIFNMGSAKIAIENNQTTEVTPLTPYLFVAYYAADNKLLQVRREQVNVNTGGFAISSLSDGMPNGATSAKLLLWDMNSLANLSDAFVQYVQ